MQPTIKRKFVPLRLLLGLGAVLLGLGGIYVQLFTDVFVSDAGTHRISLGLLALCGAIALGGLGGVWSAFFGRACSACNVALEESAMNFPPVYYPQLGAAVASAGAGDMNPLWALRAASPAVDAPYALLRYAHCPRCRQVGELRAALLEPTRDHQDVEERATSPAVVLAAPGVACVLAMRDARSAVESGQQVG